jgi:hypothetical protein
MFVPDLSQWLSVHLRNDAVTFETSLDDRISSSVY